MKVAAVVRMVRIRWLGSGLMVRSLLVGEVCWGRLSEVRWVGVVEVMDLMYACIHVRSSALGHEARCAVGVLSRG